MTAPVGSGLDVLQVNHVDLGGGGASVAGYRLHQQLRAVGVASHLLVGGATTADPDVAVLRTPAPLRRSVGALTRRAGLNDLDGVAAYGITRRADFRRADVVHYHAVHGSWFSYPALAKALDAKPSVLTLHDQWPLTGHCSFSFECSRWRSGCGRCPHPEVFPAVRRDATAVEWRIKRRVWTSGPLTVVSPSRWLADIASESILGRHPIEVIPHGIDTRAFAPGDPLAARRALRVGEDRRVICFAASAVEDPRKGFDLVIKALRRLPQSLRREITVLLMGSGGTRAAHKVEAAGCDVLPLGFVPGDELKSVVYSAADAFVFPTRADNSPLVVLEALACGTPVVAFDVGGLREMVLPDRTGDLAAPEDAGGLSAAVERLLTDRDRAAELGRAGRELAVQAHDDTLAAERHVALYRRLVEA